MKTILLIIICALSWLTPQAQQKTRPNIFGLNEIDAISTLSKDKSYSFYKRVEEEKETLLMYNVKYKDLSLIEVFHFKKDGVCFQVTNLFTKDMFTYLVDMIDKDQNNARVENKSLTWINKKSNINIVITASDEYSSITYTDPRYI